MSSSRMPAFFADSVDSGSDDNQDGSKSVDFPASGRM
jgi:hypothetical protein